MMTGKAKCENETCKGIYEVVVPVKDVGSLESKVWCNDMKFKRLRWVEKGLQAKCILKCPSCGQKVNCKITRSL